MIQIIYLPNFYLGSLRERTDARDRIARTIGDFAVIESHFSNRLSASSYRELTGEVQTKLARTSVSNGVKPRSGAAGQAFSPSPILQ
ncbi:hypothetical protein M0D69_15705 [Caballeronia sp. SEWSISQ10-4 2]|uniref:hypothetical protein n=1 Tax=Caballeronia sp. SEWSISQ10-4 2 TaxID=2937438 RepID=UPI00264BC88B|nr:hypothetical protein [Caballeronia sp. SEWSISQ10-4 2]MDN7179409.1 hypothetical protein [Caballeronia sp. SEWSISQ10-4 2]